MYNGISYLRIVLLLLAIFTISVTVVLFSNLQKNDAVSSIKYEDNSIGLHRKVLVLTYVRCGSTLLGDILQNYPDSFYAYEPLRYIDEDIDRNSTVHFLNGTTRRFLLSDSTRIHAEIIHSWFTCDFNSINIKDLTSKFIGVFSPNLWEYARCVKTQNNTAGSVRMCVKLMTKQCHQSPVRIVKTVRMKMTSVNLLMKWLPDLKVIHLIRDPRGKMHSELGLVRASATIQFINFARVICDRIMADTQLTSSLKLKFPGRINVLLYEKLATFPLETSKRIYTFLNMEFSNSTKVLVRGYTESDADESCKWCTKRTNSKSRASLWRSTIDLSLMNLIDRECYFLYKRVGYVQPADPKVIRNLSEHLLVNTAFTEGAL